MNQAARNAHAHHCQRPPWYRVPPSATAASNGWSRSWPTGRPTAATRVALCRHRPGRGPRSAGDARQRSKLADGGCRARPNLDNDLENSWVSRHGESRNESVPSTAHPSITQNRTPRPGPLVTGRRRGAIRRPTQERRCPTNAAGSARRSTQSPMPTGVVAESTITKEHRPVPDDRAGYLAAARRLHGLPSTQRSTTSREASIPHGPAGLPLVS
jgi:hypothetical protein